MNTVRRLAAIALVCLAALQPAAAQQTPAQSKAAALTAARRALSGGQPAIAIRTLEPLLAQAPGDRELVEVVISAAVALADLPRAYAFYDSYVQASGVDAPILLRPIAVRELQNVAAGAALDPRLRAEALERLGRNGDAKALNDLRQTAGLSRQTLLDDTALARLGDRDARQRIASAASSADFTDKTAVAEAIHRSGDATQAPLLVPLLQHPDPYTRAAAVEGLAALGYTAAIPAMRPLVSDPAVEVRSRAALALTRLGDAAGRETIERMKRSPVADVRLRAAEVDPSITAGERLLIIRPILADPDPMTRLRAAELLVKDEPETARPILLELIRDPDSTPRREAGRVIETMTPPDLTLYRAMMADREPWVRMYGAGAILKAPATIPR